MKIIEDWKQAWRWFSVHALAISGAIPAMWVSLPDEFKTAIPAGAMSIITAVVAVAGIVGRVIQQGQQS
ncbi:DUF7940 domain-containing protein [Dickeya poaceiphila]|uniref:Holin n=1 Tax=Dickeya poaceiphila TaxID=568768 RepID=A0A5B8I314_9GAMM|nr:hypothetical protein [Dickeya poaceiphila]QDX29542.1 hypothetical protein Dpoa569_0001317 [Dickeya poaceiphila]